MSCLNEAETIGTRAAKARGFLERAGLRGEVLVAAVTVAVQRAFTGFLASVFDLDER